MLGALRVTSSRPCSSRAQCCNARRQPLSTCVARRCATMQLQDVPTRRGPAPARSAEIDSYLLKPLTGDVEFESACEKTQQLLGAPDPTLLAPAEVATSLSAPTHIRAAFLSGQGSRPPWRPGWTRSGRCCQSTKSWVGPRPEPPSTYPHVHVNTPAQSRLADLLVDDRGTFHKGAQWAKHGDREACLHHPPHAICA